MTTTCPPKVRRMDAGTGALRWPALLLHSLVLLPIEADTRQEPVTALTGGLVVDGPVTPDWIRYLSDAARMYQEHTRPPATPEDEGTRRLPGRRTPEATPVDQKAARCGRRNRGRHRSAIAPIGAGLCAPSRVEESRGRWALAGASRQSRNGRRRSGPPSRARVRHDRARVQRRCSV